MGILEYFGLASGKPRPAPQAITSPWGAGQSGSSLMPVLMAEAITSKLDTLPITRLQAMQTPAVAKARSLLVGQIARLPLRALDGAENDVTDTATWLYRTNGELSPWHRLAWTVDDLIFYGWSLWRATRGSMGQILAAERVAPDYWRFTKAGEIELDHEVLPASEAILIPSHGEGLLEIAGATIKAAQEIDRNWQTRVKSPIPVVELHQTSNDYLTDNEIQALVNDYAKARLDPHGAVTYTPYNVEIRVHGEAKADVLVEARNAVRIDIANYLGLPAEILDGSLSTASLTYTTQQGSRSELADALRLWTGPIEARLSLDDVLPRGQRVRFDYSELESPLLSPTGAPVDD